MNIVAISGSLRKESFNTALLQALAQYMPSNVNYSIKNLDGIPLYNGDDEVTHGIPDTVVKLREEIQNAAGVIIATPEYNNSIPGVLKNAIDWLTRPPAAIKPTFHGRKVALTGATPGQGRTVLAQAAFLPIFRTLGVQLFPGFLSIGNAAQVLDPKRRVFLAAEHEESAKKFVTGFLSFLN